MRRSCHCTLRFHFTLLEAHIQTEIFDAMVITKTFLSEQPSTAHMQLPSYIFMHHNCKGKTGGGIDLYVRAQWHAMCWSADQHTCHIRPRFW